MKGYQNPAWQMSRRRIAQGASEDTVLEEAMENLKVAGQRIRATQSLMRSQGITVGEKPRPSYAPFYGARHDRSGVPSLASYLALSLLAHTMFHVPKLGFPVCLELSFGLKPYRPWHHTLGRTTRS